MVILQHLAIDLGNTNTLIAARDSEGGESLLHLRRISQIQAGLSATGDTPYTLVPSEVFHSDDGPEIGARAWATLEKDESPDAYRRYSRNFKRQLLDSFLQARHSEEGHRSLLEASTDFVRLLCHDLLQELENEFGNRSVPSLILTTPVQAPAEYRAWLREVFQEHLQPGRIQMIDESTAAAIFYGQNSFGSRVLIVDIGGSTSDITLADIGFGGDGLPVEASLISKTGKIVGGSTIDDLIADKAFEVQGLNPPASFNRKSYLRAIRAGEKVKKKLSVSQKVFDAYEDLQTGLTINMSFRQADLHDLVTESPIGSGLQALVQETIDHICQRGIALDSIQGAVLVGGCTLCPPIRSILTKSFADYNLQLLDSPTEADRFAAVVFGALRSVDAPVTNDYLLHDYAVRLKAQNGNTVYQTLFSKGTIIPCQSEYTLHSSKRSPNQIGIRISVGELYRQLRQVPVGLEASNEVAPMVVSDFRPLGTEGHLVVIPVDPAAPVGQRRYRISFGIDSDRQLRITADDTVTQRRILDNAVISDLTQSSTPSSSSQTTPESKPNSSGTHKPQRILELNPNPSYNSLEVEVANVLGDMSIEGYLISNVILDGRTLYEVDHLLITPSGQAYIIGMRSGDGTIAV